MSSRTNAQRTPRVLCRVVGALLAAVALSAAAADQPAAPSPSASATQATVDQRPAARHAAASQPAPARTVVAIDPDEIVFDRPQAEWSQAYLQWVAAFPRGSSPVSDTSGALCGAKQGGDVWFLASSDGTAPVERHCTVPSGKTLFVPIASVLERSGNREPDCAAMARVAATNLTHVNAMSLSVDGKALDDIGAWRQASGGCFALGLRLVPRQDARQAVSDGWFAMLPPLAPGAHTIVVQARFDSTPLSTTYHLDVH